MNLSDSRLEEIKKHIGKSPKLPPSPEQVAWLISQLEEKDREIARLQGKNPKKWEIKHWIDKCEKAEAEIKQLQERLPPTDAPWTLKELDDAKARIVEQDQEIERLNKRLLEICHEAGESVHCPPSPIDAFRILKARIADQNREIEWLRRHQDSGPITEQDYLTTLEQRAEKLEADNRRLQERVRELG